MSNALAIAAVTSSLVSLLASEISSDPALNLPSGIHVTALPPDGANNDAITHQVNVFLYHVMPNAAWRNMPIPTQVRQGESGMPPLALNLYYMITAYTRDTNEIGDISSQSLLGRVMSIFHDNPVLGPGQLAMPESDIQNQVDHVRITMQPLSIEEIYRLWTGFQTQYRTSVGYEVSVVLIDSTLPTRTPLPVLKRGRDGRGATAVADPLPYPTLFSVSLRDIKMPTSLGDVASPNAPAYPPSAMLGDVLAIAGHRLDGPTVTVLLASQRLAVPLEIVVPQTARSSTGITLPFQLNPQQPGPDPATDYSTWPAGFYTLSARISQPTPPGQPLLPDQVTNELALSLAPQIDTRQLPTATRDANNDVTITLNCIPDVQIGQRVALLLGEKEIVAPQPIAQTNALTFAAGNMAAGTYLLRLRIDGVDSFPYIRSSDPIKTPPTFDDKQRVTIV